MERRLACLSLSYVQMRCRHVVDEVLEDVFAAGLHSVMQQRAASCVLQQDVRPLLVELCQLHNNNTVRHFSHQVQLNKGGVML